MEKSTSHWNRPALTNLVEHTPIDALQVGYDSSKVEVMTLRLVW